MNIDEFCIALARRFPKHAEEIAAWKPDYRTALSAPDLDIAESLRATLARWTKSYPPKPGEIDRRRARSGDGRHPLYVHPPCDPDAMTEIQAKTWQYENGPLFLTRLGYWKSMRVSMGEVEAADVLKLGRDGDEIYRLFDQWRHGESFDPQRIPEKNFAIVETAMKEIRENLAVLGAKTAFMKGGQPKPSPRMNDRMRGLADQHRAAREPAQTQQEDVA